MATNEYDPVTHLTKDEQAKLDRLYPSSKPATPTADPDSSSLARRLYGFGDLEGAINRRAADLWKQTGAGEPEQRQLRETFVGIAKAGVAEGLTRLIAESYIDSEIGAARPETDAEASARDLEQQIGKWDSETREYLRGQYGPQAGEDLLARTRRYVASVPALKNILNTHGLGSRPAVVKALVSHVFSTGFR